MEPKLGPEPPRTVFRIVKITLVFYCISGTGGSRGRLGGASKNWPKNGAEIRADIMPVTRRVGGICGARRRGMGR